MIWGCMIFYAVVGVLHQQLSVAGGVAGENTLQRRNAKNENPAIREQTALPKKIRAKKVHFSARILHISFPPKNYHTHKLSEF